MDSLRKWHYLAPMLLGFTACKARTLGDAAPSVPYLDGGQPVQEGEFPSVVYLYKLCTAVKVAEKHFLLAAHCVLDDTHGKNIKFRLSIGQRLLVSTARKIDLTGPLPLEKAWHLTIADVFPHPHYAKYWIERSSLENPGKYSDPVWQSLAPPDLAIVEVDENTPEIPTAFISPDAIAPGDLVTFGGYGCESGLKSTTSQEIARLKVHEAKVLPPHHMKHPESLVPIADARNLERTHFLTPGPAGGFWHLPWQRRAGLCHGDSGGPVFRWENGRDALVGINALGIPFRNSPNGKVFTNWHVRLDSASLHNTFDWIHSHFARESDERARMSTSQTQLVAHCERESLQGQQGNRRESLQVRLLLERDDKGKPLSLFGPAHPRGRKLTEYGLVKAPSSFVQAQIKSIRTLPGGSPHSTKTEMDVEGRLSFHLRSGTVEPHQLEMVTIEEVASSGHPPKRSVTLKTQFQSQRRTIQFTEGECTHIASPRL